MEHTAQYQLNKWSETDRILMEDFNADNDKLEQALAAAGNCKIVTGTYTGTGSYGESNPHTLTFDKRPLLLVISSKYTLIIPCQSTTGRTIPLAHESGRSNYFTWASQTLSWYNQNDAESQLNTKGETYHYLAFFTN